MRHQNVQGDSALGFVTGFSDKNPFVLTREFTREIGLCR